MFRDANYIVVSYRSDGVPSAWEMCAMLKAYKKHVEVRSKQFQYVLSKKRTEELLFIAY